MKKKPRVAPSMLSVVILLIVAVACSETPKPSNSDVEGAVKSELQNNLPGRWIGMSVPGKEAQFTAIEIIEWGKFNKELNYWPVKVRVEGVAKVYRLFPLGKSDPVNFNEVAEFRFVQDDFGDWQWTFLRPSVFGGESWEVGKRRAIDADTQEQSKPASAPPVDQEKIAAAKNDIRKIEVALNLYRLDNYVYPTTDQGLQSLVHKPGSPEPANWKSGGYLTNLPLDPWGQPYQYQAPGGHGAIDIYSKGPNKMPNDVDDVVNWSLN